MVQIIADISAPDLDTFITKMKGFPRLRDAALRRGTRKSVKLLLEETKKRTPVRTGRLRRGWRKKILQSGRRATVFNKVPYGIFVEEGTRFIKARKFFDKAIEFSSPKIDRIYADEMEIALRKVAQK